jgi:hypothetical protein
MTILNLLSKTTNMLKIALLLSYLLVLLQFQFATAQGEIMIFNPSFEDPANHSTTPILWDDCGSIGNSPPDIHSSFSNLFNVQKDAQDGRSFVGMVVRDDATWEAIGQTLEQPLLPNYQYQFSIYLARSNNYRSLSKRNRVEVDFNEATVLRVWGGNYSGDRGELLVKSLPIYHTDWQEYTFEFEPTKVWEYFILEAYFEDDDGFAYNGNLLLDNCSPIYIYNNIKRSEILDYDELSNADLLNLIIDCKKDDSFLTDTFLLDKVYDSWLFEQTCRDVGMDYLVPRMDSLTLAHYLNIYAELGLVQPIEIIHKTRLFVEKDSNILSEVRFLRNVNELFQNSLITEKLYDKRLNYIRENREMIIEKLKACAS